jgi:hypothetical protein
MHGSGHVIRNHQFNSIWWGKPVGSITDAAFFEQPLGEQQEQLGRYDWVEFRQLYDKPPPVWSLAAAGFTHVDVQIRFKLGMHQVAESASLGSMDAVFAADDPFEISSEDIAHFEHERFLLLPGATVERVNARYVNWANALINDNPQWCMEIRVRGVPQGWFISQMEGSSLNLTLAALRKDASISGMHLYNMAMVEYAKRGARIGFASYSATNTQVMAIYAKLGVRYLVPEGFWFWARTR